MGELSWIWGVIIIGGPLALLAALIWVKFQTAKPTQAEDPDTASDDPSKGMTGHD